MGRWVSRGGRGFSSILDPPPPPPGGVWMGGGGVFSGLGGFFEFPAGHFESAEARGNNCHSPG